MATNSMFPAAAGGALSGAATGFAVGGPIGAGIGGLIGLASGIGAGKENNKALKAYEQAEAAIPFYDPTQQAHLARIRQQERQFRAGTDPSSAFAAMNARNVGVQTQNNMLRAGGPNVQSQLLRAQSGTNNAFANIGAQAAAGANQMLQYQGGLIDAMADRKYQRQRELRNQAMARYEQGRQDINNTLSGGLAMIPQIAMSGGFGGGAPKMGGTTQRAPNLDALYQYDWTAPRAMPTTFPQGAPLDYTPR